MKMPKGLICFDLDGLYFTKQSFQNFKKFLAPKSETSKRDLVLALSNEMKLFKTGKISEQQYWDYVRKELDLDITNEEIFSKLRESYEEDIQVKKLVQKIKKIGYKTAICSNNFITRIRELDKKFDFLKDFDVKIFSYKTGYMKPDQKIFEALIEASGLGGKDIIYSDDTEEKLLGAKNIGIQTFVFHNFEQFIQDLKEYGVGI